jgi:hypothetical protein
MQKPKEYPAPMMREEEEVGPSSTQERENNANKLNRRRYGYMGLL